MVTDTKKQQAEKIFIEIAEKETEYGEIKEQIRNLHSRDELDDEQYNYILENWDKLLQKHNLLRNVTLTEFEETKTCDWCHEEYDITDLTKTNLGYLCDRCIRAITSRGETFSIEVN